MISFGQPTRIGVPLILSPRSRISSQVESNHQDNEMSLQRRFARKRFFADYCAIIIIFRKFFE
ncbi:hypothetical protein RHECNPAF_1740062 [Rhizobium etli CNPAF512]|nr:hypothetical protein RHECNPAF_1740062 [Rhizobium etli CNPAF512]